MKIQREVNGQVLEFELTRGEMVEASEELEKWEREAQGNGFGIEDAVHLTVWGDGTQVEVPCKINHYTGKVFDTEFPKEEYVRYADGRLWPVMDGLLLELAQGDETREMRGKEESTRTVLFGTVGDAIKHCCRELNLEENPEPARRESDFKAIFESERFFGLYYYHGDNEYWLVNKETGDRSLVLGDSYEYVGKNYLNVLQGDTVLKVYDRELLEYLVDGVNENARGFIPDEQITGVSVLEEALEVVWVTVYKDVLGIREEDDNLTQICVPKLWLKEALREQQEYDMEGWLDEYTADWTVDIARKALDEGAVMDCSNPGFGLGAVVDYEGRLCEVVSMKDGRVYLQDVNNDSHWEPKVKNFFRWAKRVDEKDVSRSALDCVEASDNKESLLRAAMDFYGYDVDASIQDPYFMKHADELIYAHQEGVEEIDLDFWIQYEVLLGEKLTYDEYRFVDGLYDGDPLELIDVKLSEEEMSVFSEIKKKLVEWRIEKGQGSLEDAISAADGLKEKPTDIGRMPDRFKDLEI